MVGSNEGLVLGICAWKGINMDVKQPTKSVVDGMDSNVLIYS